MILFGIILVVVCLFAGYLLGRFHERQILSEKIKTSLVEAFAGLPPMDGSE